MKMTYICAAVFAGMMFGFFNNFKKEEELLFGTVSSGTQFGNKVRYFRVVIRKQVGRWWWWFFESVGYIISIFGLLWLVCNDQKPTAIECASYMVGSWLIARATDWL